MRPGERFTKDLPDIPIWDIGTKYQYVGLFTQIKATEAQENFAHVTTALLSWHVQNFVVI